jgi:hypothetical protein
MTMNRKPIDALCDIPSVLDVAAGFGDPDTARGFLETLIRPSGPFCPFCGSFHVWRFRAEGRTSRPGLPECADGNSQFTVTTRTPLHSTNLPLVTWIVPIHLPPGGVA